MTFAGYMPPEHDYELLTMQAAAMNCTGVLGSCYVSCNLLGILANTPRDRPVAKKHHGCDSVTSPERGNRGENVARFTPDTRLGRQHTEHFYRAMSEMANMTSTGLAG